MKLKFLKLLLCAIALVMVFISCGDDDESNRTELAEGETVPDGSTL